MRLTHLLLAAGFAVSALLAQWEPPRQLTFDANPALIPAGNAKALAACDSGVLQAIWFDGRNGPFSVYGKRSTDAGLTWADDENLSLDPDTAWCPSIVATGNLLHLMYRAHRGNWRLCYRRSTDAGASWPAEVYLDSSISMGGGNVTNATAGRYLHAMWPTWVSADNSEIFYRRSTDSGATWLPKVRLTLDSARSEDPCVALSGPYVHVVWFDTRTGGQNQFHKRSTDYGASWSSDVQMTDDSGFSYFPMVAATDSAVHFARQTKRGGGFHILCRRSDDNGASWGPDLQVDSGNGTASSPVLFASGNVIRVAWNDARSGTTQLYDRFSTDNGVTWSQEETLTHAAGNSGSPAFSAIDSLLNVTYTNDSSGIRQVWYLRNPRWNVGAEEGSWTQAPKTRPQATIVRGALSLPDCTSPSWLLDAAGRRVANLVAGPNDVFHLAPGVYFGRACGSTSRGALGSSIRKILVAR